MDDNDKQMTLPGMEDSDELTNPLTSSTKELVNELLQDDAQLTPQPARPVYAAAHVRPHHRPLVSQGPRHLAYGDEL